MTTRWILAVVVLAALACGGRQHLQEGYGSSYHSAFDVQANPRPEPARATTGLDSQEAAIVSQTYRASLAPQDTKPKDQPILIVAPPTPGMPKLPPSVPPER